MAAAVPGAVHYDLVRAGRLDNPLASRQAAANAAWVADSDWLYRHTFVLQEAVGRDTRPILTFQSLDTFADIWLNGVLVGSSANMFRSCCLAIDPTLLRRGENTLLMHVKAHQRVLADAMPDSARIAVGPHSTAHRDRSLIRRYQRSYNTSLLNLGENVIGIGIPGHVSLSLHPSTYIADLCLVTDALETDTAAVRVLARLGGEVTDATLEVMLYEDGADEASVTALAPLLQGQATCSLSVPNPRLWWPAGYGEPHLYRLEARVWCEGRVAHALLRRVGIKTVALARELPNGRPTFQVRVNGCDVYVRGGNLMPIDAIRGMSTAEDYERMLQLTVNANMNLIRLWGGGLPEDEHFLDRCDALGVMVWQDFLYHSSTYPDYDAGFMAEAEAEAADIIAKMRPHACLAVLCGGNEQQQGWDEWGWKQEMDRFYGERLFNELLPRVCAGLAPEIPYVPNSPHGGVGGQSPVIGDTHTWGNYYNATKDPLFVTETCWIYDSYSRPETLHESMGLDVDALAELGWPRRWRELTGLSLYTKFPFTHYYDIANLQGYLRALEIEQLEADYQSLAYLRFRSPSCNGLVYWPLNKGGPLFGFGCIDYAGRPLMAYYAVQRLFADVALHMYRDAADIRIVAANATKAPVVGVLRIWQVTSSGRVRSYWELPTVIASGNSVRLFDMGGLYDAVIDRGREWVYAEFAVGGAAVASAQLFFCPLAELQIEPCTLTVAAHTLGPGRWRLDVATTAPTPLIEIEADQRVMYSDDYFGLIPGIKKQVFVTALGDAQMKGIHVTLSGWDRSESASVTLT
jgi:beta-mannosidase